MRREPYQSFFTCSNWRLYSAACWLAWKNKNESQSGKEIVSKGGGKRETRASGMKIMVAKKECRQYTCDYWHSWQFIQHKRNHGEDFHSPPHYLISLAVQCSESIVKRHLLVCLVHSGTARHILYTLVLLRIVDRGEQICTRHSRFLSHRRCLSRIVSREQDSIFNVMQCGWRRHASLWRKIDQFRLQARQLQLKSLYNIVACFAFLRLELVSQLGCLLLLRETWDATWQFLGRGIVGIGAGQSLLCTR